MPVLNTNLTSKPYQPTPLEMMSAVDQELARRAKDKQLKEKQTAESSLMGFVKAGWHVLEPGQPFIDGWHLHAIADHLQAVTDGHIRNLVVNMPPRFCKSLMISVFWPVYVWLKRPSARWMYASYAASLSTRDSLKCRRLIESPWFQANWSDRFQLTSDQNAKTRFDNNKMGYRLSTSVGGAATGEGGNFVCCLPYNALVSTVAGLKEVGKIVESLDKSLVLSYNHANDEIEAKEITSYQINPVKDFIEIELEDGKLLTCTVDHPVYTTNRGYVEAQYLTVDDEVLTLE
jgi:hypothetical protein